MTNWDIDPNAAFGVVRTAATEAEGYETDLTAVETAMSDLGAALPNSQLVVQALSEYATEVVAPHVETALGHTNSAVRGTSDAINAYVAGDLEMAATAQSNAATVQYPAEMPGGSGGRAPAGTGQGE
ncbi:DUF6507 family protein [Nocardioides sp. CFH 31398]|uniref:DUF6507 family protein n=1 Tax=Nocardioides sp. CFH 31398 TaxID=2919579 RepID=UPI001F06567E|nr:DUF6507 family protein [Nocardioides sp. CFH 31398]MCH1865812.1 DUF6507 family protein [Nocardioides sp. CFH 31398]